MFRSSLESSWFSVARLITKWLFLIVTLPIILVSLREFIHVYIDNASIFPDDVDNTLANQLSTNIRVLCWVMTHPANHETRARSVLKTWGRRCNRLLIMSSEADETLDTVVLPVSEGREHLWDKVREAFKYVYANHRDEYDWVLKADDDTYVIMENLRYMLHGYSPDERLHFGCKFRMPSSGDVFMSGGAGYVMSREAVRLFVEVGIGEDQCTNGFGGVDDVAIGEWIQLWIVCG